MPRNAATPEGSKNKQVNATIPAALYAALDDYRWTARIDGMTKMVVTALEEYAANHGLTVADEDPQEPAGK